MIEHIPSARVLFSLEITMSLSTNSCPVPYVWILFLYSITPTLPQIGTVDDLGSISGGGHSGKGRWHIGLLGAKTHLS